MSCLIGVDMDGLGPNLPFLHVCFLAASPRENSGAYIAAVVFRLTLISLYLYE